MDTIIAFFSIIGSSEVNVTLLVIILFIILGVSITIIQELDPTLPAAPYGFLAFLFLLYLSFAISCAYISHHKFAPQDWFTKIPVKEQQMFTDYFKKHKYAALTIYQYEAV